jgi:hypothetical protein
MSAHVDLTVEVPDRPGGPALPLSHHETIVCLERIATACALREMAEGFEEENRIEIANSMLEDLIHEQLAAARAAYARALGAAPAAEPAR